MFDELVCLCNGLQRKRFGNLKPLPACLKCLINSAGGFNLCFSRYIVTADKENSGVDKDELPDENFCRGGVGGLSRDRTTLR